MGDQMKKFIYLAAALLCLNTSLSFAADDGLKVSSKEESEASQSEEQQGEKQVSSASSEEKQSSSTDISARRRMPCPEYVMPRGCRGRVKLVEDGNGCQKPVCSNIGGDAPKLCAGEVRPMCRGVIKRDLTARGCIKYRCLPNLPGPGGGAR